MQTSLPLFSQVSLLRQLLGCSGSADCRNFEICLLQHLKLLATTNLNLKLVLWSKVKPQCQVTTNEEKLHDF